MRHVVPHSLEEDRARALLEEVVAHYAARHPHAALELSWVGDSLAEVSGSARGHKLRARIELQPGRAVVEMDVPFLLRPFQEVARRAVDREARRWLERDG